MFDILNPTVISIRMMVKEGDKNQNRVKSVTKDETHSESKLLVVHNNDDSLNSSSSGSKSASLDEPSDQESNNSDTMFNTASNEPTTEISASDCDMSELSKTNAEQVVTIQTIKIGTLVSTSDKTLDSSSHAISIDFQVMPEEKIDPLEQLERDPQALRNKSTQTEYNVEHAAKSDDVTNNQFCVNQNATGTSEDM